MSKLSPEQIAQAAHDAGFRGNDLTTAVAVALAESSGDPRAHNPVPPDDSYGLWQINMIGGLGPDRRDQFDLDSNRELFDPETNAQAAFAISGKGDSFQPWTTFTSGAYKSHLDEARKGVHALRDNDKDGDKNDSKNDGKHGGNAVTIVILLAFAAVGVAVSMAIGNLIPLGVMILLGALAMPAPKIALQWERAVVMRFGRFTGLRGPGLFWIVPFVDHVSSAD